MKKLSLLFLALVALVTLKAQWVDDPISNTSIANCNKNAAEVYVSTDVSTGDSYVQWHYQGENGWSPWLQRLDFNGVPQWPADGIHVTTPDFATWSPGYSMTAVIDGVVTVFRTLGPHHWAVKINADGTFPWGEHGMVLFDSEGGVFVVYAKQTLQGYTNYNKEIHVAGYNKNGEQIFPETLLFGQQTVGASYVHYATPDNKGGGYVYQFHNAIGGVYNTYVTHFDENGTPTISDPNGIAVHSPDYSNYYTNAYATVGLWTNDLIIAYLQKDAASQSQHRIYVNRITESGEKPWGDGILVADYTGLSYSDIHVDANDYAGGFVVTYGTSQGSIEAVGYDLDGNLLWNTTMSSTGYNKAISENTTGFYEGQNIVAWVNSDDGGVYGQNIGWDGALGEVSPLPPPPIPCCYAPEYFEGSYLYNEETASYGAMLTWEAPAYSVLHYNLYRENLDNGTTDVIEIDAEATAYFDDATPSTYKYQLTAMYDDFESEFALTPDGEDFIIIEVTSVPENESGNEIVTLLRIYSTCGQVIRKANLGELSSGVYIVQGLTSTGKLVTKKVVLNNK